MIMTLFEKTEYINQDFKRSALYLLGDMPDNKVDANSYFIKAVKAAGDFCKKYIGKGKYIEDYASAIVLDYMDSLENAYKKLIE